MYTDCVLEMKNSDTQIFKQLNRLNAEPVLSLHTVGALTATLENWEYIHVYQGKLSNFVIFFPGKQ